jgi:flagellar P-ring protein precursor FlgI
MRQKNISVILTFLISIFFLEECLAARIKDIAHLDGVRQNQLYGYGLVVGLNGTGDQQGAAFTLQAVGNMLRRFGINIPPASVATQIRARNVAAVIVTADLPAFAKSGTRIDITVSSIGDATSLVGGTLMQTPLQAADGNVYAVAQGSLSTGVSANTAMPTKGPLNVARIPNGALIEKEVPSTMIKNGAISIFLNNPDFSTAERVLQAINQGFNSGIASAVDASTVKVEIPEQYRDTPVSLIAKIELMQVEPDTVAKVIINERTGTIVAGKDVRVSTVAVTHGSISVQIVSKREITEETVQSRSYPPKGELMSNSDSVNINGEGTTKVAVMEEGVNINELAGALNRLGVSAKDLIAILQAIKAAGALQAEIEVI